MSALPPKADIGTEPRDVRYVPIADIAPNCSIVCPMSAETLAIQLDQIEGDLCGIRLSWVVTNR